MQETFGKVILMKYGEVVLKGLNRKHFEQYMLKDATKKLEKIGNYRISSAQSTMYVRPLDEEALENIDLAAKACTKVFGILAVSVANELPKDTDTLLDFIGDYVHEIKANAKTFKVIGKRSDKKFPLKSPELAALCGGKILEVNPELTVDVNHPDLEVRVEIRDFAAYVHAGKMKGAGGMPAGSAGKAVLLLSGGIDSPVAGYVCCKRGVSLEALHFDSFPYTSERAREKVIELAETMQDYCGHIQMHVISLTEIQEEIKRNCKEDYFTLLLRRFMMRLAERFALSVEAGAVITGESLGQVASQTMRALGVTDDAVKTLPVFRPLIAMDKEQIIEVARQIGTYDISIQPFEDCCTVFTPRHPVTSPILEKVLKEEEKLDIEALTDRAFASLERIRLY